MLLWTGYHHLETNQLYTLLRILRYSKGFCRHWVKEASSERIHMVHSWPSAKSGQLARPVQGESAHCGCRDLQACLQGCA